MGRLGTESAFEVARPRPRRSSGRASRSIHLEDRRAPGHFEHAPKPHQGRGPSARLGRRGPRRTTGPSAGLPELCAEAIREDTSPRTARRPPLALRAGGRHAPAAKPIMFLHDHDAWPAPATRSIYPNPGFPIYESVIKFRGRDGGADSAARVERVWASSPRAVRKVHLAPDQADHHQLARETRTGGRAGGRGQIDRIAGPSPPRGKRAGDVGRDLIASSSTTGEFVSIYNRPGHGRAHDSSSTAFSKSYANDRLAAGAMASFRSRLVEHIHAADG